MYNRRKKIIIIMVIILLIVLLAIGGIFAYITTDLFKSNQTLFFKYMGQTLESIKYEENTQLSEIETLKEQKPYTIAGNLNFEVGETNTDLNANALSKLGLNIEAKVNKPDEKAYAKANLTHNNQNLFTIEYANSNNIYALKSDEIVTAFLGIENENLKVLAQKLGIYDTTSIPDSINFASINEILDITDEEKSHITETYLSVLTQNINKENFSKESNIAVKKENVTYNATGYRLNLNSEELKQVEIALLQVLKEDSITLNILTTKAKLLGLDEKYTQINNLTNEIEKQIKTINNSNTALENGLSIVVYVDKQEVILTEIIFRNEIKYTIYGTTNENANKRYLLIESLSGSSLSSTIENKKIEITLNETKSNIETIYNALINIDDNIGIDIYLTNTGAASENSLNTTCEVNVSKGDLTSTIMYEQEMKFEKEINDIIELSRNNCGVLNDYTTEQLQVLIQSIKQRIETILKEKKQAIGWMENVELNDPELQQIDKISNLEEKFSRMKSKTIEITKSEIRSEDSISEPYGVFVIMFSYDIERPELGFKSPSGKLYYTDCQNDIQTENYKFGVVANELWTTVALPAEEGIWTIYYDKKNNGNIDYSVVDGN